MRLIDAIEALREADKEIEQAPIHDGHGNSYIPAEQPPKVYPALKPIWTGIPRKNSKSSRKQRDGII